MVHLASKDLASKYFATLRINEPHKPLSIQCHEHQFHVDVIAVHNGVSVPSWSALVKLNSLLDKQPEDQG